MVSSADVRISIAGHVTSVYSTDPVTTSLMTHVDASMPFLLMDNTASLCISSVSSFVVIITFTPVEDESYSKTLQQHMF